MLANPYWLLHAAKELGVMILRGLNSVRGRSGDDCGMEQGMDFGVWPVSYSKY
jgi:hypothetical protein